MHKRKEKMNMKKVIMAMAVAAYAAVASAAAFDWKTSPVGKIYEAGTTTLLASGTAYIFDSSTVSRQTLVEYFAANGSMKEGSLHSKAISNGVIAATGSDAFMWSGGDDLVAYIAVISDGKILVSDVQTKVATETGYSQFSFNIKEASQSAAREFTTGDTVSAGWYTAVPEPTSGLLMLVGLAGLALRRRRA